MESWNWNFKDGHNVGTLQLNPKGHDVDFGSHRLSLKVKKIVRENFYFRTFGVDGSMKIVLDCDNKNVEFWLQSEEHEDQDACESKLYTIHLESNSDVVETFYPIVLFNPVRGNMQKCRFIA